LEIPPEENRVANEAIYTEEEDKAAKRTDHDIDHEDKPSIKSFLDLDC
jgi:hypothetical protein